MKNLELSTLSTEGVKVTTYAVRQSASYDNSQVDEFFKVMLWYKDRHNPVGIPLSFTLEKGSDLREQLLLGAVMDALDALHADARVDNCVINVVSESCEILLKQIEVDFVVHDDGMVYAEIDTNVHEEEEVMISDEVKSFLSSNSGVRFISGDKGSTDMECCSVCLEEFEKPIYNSGDGELDDVVILPCSHVLHEDCLVPWIAKGKNTCPFCRYDLIPYLILLFDYLTIE
ncbi:E3 ubiquitin-protein ligase RNF13 [Bienertia sinuspersici]